MSQLPGMARELVKNCSIIGEKKYNNNSQRLTKKGVALINKKPSEFVEMLAIEVSIKAKRTMNVGSLPSQAHVECEYMRKIKQYLQIALKPSVKPNFFQKLFGSAKLPVIRKIDDWIVKNDPDIKRDMNSVYKFLAEM